MGDNQLYNEINLEKNSSLPQRRQVRKEIGVTDRLGITFWVLHGNSAISLGLLRSLRIFLVKSFNHG